ncbi:MAG TPA: hypothetical protein PKA58_10530 [Polyangium sp.]|nr:hypothetical protein [Polyangium sp.]
MTDSLCGRKALFGSAWATSPDVPNGPAKPGESTSVQEVRSSRSRHEHLRSMYSLQLTMDALAALNVDDDLHELISRSLVHRRALWLLVLSTYRVELTQILDHEARRGYSEDDRALVIDMASRIAVVATEVELAAVRSDALSLRNYADTESQTEDGERRVLRAGIQLIDRILEVERDRRNAERSTDVVRPN